MVRKPHRAATPKATIKPKPIKRPETVLLLQDWSTATTQTTKSRMAPAPKAFSHMLHFQSAAECAGTRLCAERAHGFHAGAGWMRDAVTGVTWACSWRCRAKGWNRLKGRPRHGERRKGTD